MKNTLGLFTIIIATALLSLTACHRDTPAHIADEIDSGIASAMQDENRNLPPVPAIAENDLTQSPAAPLANEITIFTPLNDNEQFAINFQAVPQAFVLPWNVMTIFAMRDNDFQDVSVLFSREPVHVHDVQFANNFKKCFFMEEDWRHPDKTIPYIHVHRHIYMANGFTGEIRRLLSNIGSVLWRVSHDGRFIGFIDANSHREYTHINLFDVENGVMIGQFGWKPTMTGAGHVFGWQIHRFENIFRVSAFDEVGVVATAAELDLFTLELTPLLRDDILQGQTFMPHIDEDIWRDDIFVRNNIPLAILR